MTISKFPDGGAHIITRSDLSDGAHVRRVVLEVRAEGRADLVEALALLRRRPRVSYFLSHVHHFTRHSKTLYPIKLTSGTKYLGPPGIIRHIVITIVDDRYNRYARYIY